jgi:N-methylhydantoinase A
MLVDFENEHERLYGHRSDPDNPLEVVIVRLIGRVESRVPQKFEQQTTDVDHRSTSRRAYFGKTSGEIDTPVVQRSELINPTPGPVLIDEYDSTIVVPPGFTAHMDEHGNLLMTGIDR